MTNILQDPLTIFRSYCAVKAHFSSDYDIIKYNGKIKISDTALSKRTDRILFEQLAKMLHKQDNIPFFVAQFIENLNLSISEIVLKPMKAKKYYTYWKERILKYQSNITKDLETLEQYCWEQDLKMMNLSDKEIFSASKDYPVLFKLLTMKKISPESYTLLDNVFHHLDTESEDVLVRDVNFKLKKYRRFLAITDEKVVDIARNVYK